MTRKRILAVLSVGLISFVLIFSVPVLAAETPPAATLFHRNCAGCHPNGSNIIRRGKNLKMGALKRNQMDSFEAITQIITYGKNNMSAFGDRLTPSEIEAIATYVLEKAENNWR